MRVPRKALAVAAAAATTIAFVIIGIRSVRLTEQELRERVIATIQSEARASFLVTGSLDLTATTSVESTKILLPRILNLSLGTSNAMVQVPGRAYYGFDVRKLDENHIKLRGDTVEVAVPQPMLLSVDPNLAEMRVWTTKGWLRTPASVDAVERKAIQRIDKALATQAAAHVASSAQPHINSAHALEKMLKPVLVSAGLKKPVFRFRIGERLILND